MKKEKPHCLQLLIRAVVRDPDGNVINDTGQKPARSFLIQFLEFIVGMFDGVIVEATATTGGEEYLYYPSDLGTYLLSMDAPINNSSHGIVVGTGFTAETNTDYKLETQLTEGMGAGNITHGVVVFGTTGVAGANVDLELKRAFTNNTGSVIGVKEVGMYTRYTTGPIHCIVRDVLPGTVNVPDKCSLTIIYTMRTTV